MRRRAPANQFIHSMSPLFEVPDWDLGPLAQATCHKKLEKKRSRTKRITVPGSDLNHYEKRIDSQASKQAKASKKFKEQALVTTVPVNTASKSLLPAKLLGARFRFLNERLYQSTSREALEYFKENPSDFDHYHNGFREQTKSWPVNPVDIFIRRLEEKVRYTKKEIIVVDMGCGEAKIAHTLASVSRLTVHSYDLVAINPLIKVANMTAVPLTTSSTDLVIFCLSLMNTDYEAALVEANRILCPGGSLWIAEVNSRFNGSSGLEAFRKSLQRLGFKVTNTDQKNSVFVLLDAIKQEFPKSFTLNNHHPAPILKPCFYKKR